MLWSGLIDILRGSLFVLAHWCGGSLGTAIIVASVAMRVALLPLTLGAARRRLVRERTNRGTVAWRELLDALVQLPPSAALYAAVRGAVTRAGGFLWIADLGAPDLATATIAGGLVAATTWFSATTPGGSSMRPVAPAIISAMVTGLLLFHLSAGLAIYSVANMLVFAGERRVAARRLPRPGV
jgi:membrane protein insertase Oxa1/YidC/SpoIIIJ